MTTKSIFVKDLASGQSIKDVFMLTEARQAQAKNGPYWALTLADNTGEVPAKIFSPHAQAVHGLEAGMFVQISGQVGVYRDQPQIVADNAEVLDFDEEGLRLGDFVPASERDPEEMLADIERLCKKHLTHKPWRSLCRKVLTDKSIKERIIAAPGAVSIHHAYAGGLLEHTLSVCNLCMSFCDLYPKLDRQALLVAAIFHDLGKAWEYTTGPLRDMTDEGRLLGHIQIGLNLLDTYFSKTNGLDKELVMHVKHMIVSHHGELEFGSPKRPKTAEAFALHFADNIDAKLKTVAETVEGAMNEGEPGWTQFVRPLQRFVYNPAKTPDPNAENGEEEQDTQLCLLPLKG